MRIRSPLSNLAEVIGDIRHAAQEHGKKLKTNEAATRAVLIAPQHVLKQVPAQLLTVPAAVALAKPKETA